MVPSLSLPKRASMTCDANKNTYFGGKTCLENSLHARQTQPALAPCFREAGLENVSLFSALFHNSHNACTAADAPARFFPNSPFLRYRFQFGVCGSFGRSAGGRTEKWARRRRSAGPKKPWAVLSCVAVLGPGAKQPSTPPFRRATHGSPPGV